MTITASQITVGDLRAVLESRHPRESVEFIGHTPQECCPGHVHDITELVPDFIELDDAGPLIIRLKELHA